MTLSDCHFLRMNRHASRLCEKAGEAKMRTSGLRLALAPDLAALTPSMAPDVSQTRASDRVESRP